MLNSVELVWLVELMRYFPMLVLKFFSRFDSIDLDLNRLAFGMLYGSLYLVNVI